MMRKFTFTLLLVLAFGFASFSQYTASLQTITASPNENVSVNLDVTNFTSIGSFQFYIQLDQAVLTYQNVTNFSQPGLMIGTAGGGNILTVIWTNPTPHTWANGTLLTLNFKYNGLSCPIAFIPANCEVVKMVGVTPVILTGTFTNGAISPYQLNTAQATIDNVLSPLGTVPVPLKYTGFPTNVGSITQKISYDPAKLTFISVTGSGNLSSGLMSATASGGIITILWTSPTGKDINAPASQFNLNFSYTMLSTTNVNFSTGCIITTTAPVVNIPVTYFNGSVAPPPVITSFASMPAITTAVQGQMVDVPLTFSGMPAGTNNFNLNLTYDIPRMSFIGIFNPMYPINSNVNGNAISINYVNPAAPDINGQFLVLRFMYNGIGTANINFASGCQFSNGSPIGVGYTNGSVSPAPAVVNANIGFMAATSPSSVAIPVTFTNIPAGTDIGAVTMNIAYDASKLTYINALNPNGATIQVNGNVLHIAWSSAVPVIVNGTPFITLNFNYAASGNATAMVIFKDGCQLANMVGAIVPANWNNGGINTLFKLSGTVTYDVPSSVILDNITIYVKDGPEPVPPAVTPVPNILYTTTTDASGYYQINLPNGTYYVYAATTKAWEGVDGGDVIQIRRQIAGLSNGVDGSPLRLRSADVSQDGSIDGTDVIALRRKIAFLSPNPNYRALDWLFDNPMILMNGADVNQDFKGLCSGEVNGSYPN